MKQSDARPLISVKIEKIEAPHLVGTVVRTVPRTDAPVVRHFIQALVAVSRRTDRTNRLTRRFFAVLTQHRLEKHLRVVLVTLVIVIDAQPLHFPLPARLNFPYDRDVVLSLACNNTRVAPDTRA